MRRLRGRIWYLTHLRRHRYSTGERVHALADQMARQWEEGYEAGYADAADGKPSFVQQEEQWRELAGAVQPPYCRHTGETGCGHREMPPTAG